MRSNATGRAAFFALLVSQMAATMGFLFVMPFMPLYVEQLGVESARDAAAWAGVLNAATAVTMAVTAPLWGRVADRFGPKSMLLRATVAGAIVVGLMGLVTSPWQLLWLRLLQGCLTGTVAAATLLASETAPAGKGGSRLGTLQTIIFLAAAAGPFVGGVFADLVGIRASFGVTAGLLAMSSVVVLIFVGDVKPKGAEAGDEEEPRTAIPWRRIAPVLFALFVVQVSITAVAPALPGFISTLLSDASNVASLSGRILGAGALAAAAGAMLGGRVAQKVGAKPVIIFALVFSGMAFLPQAAVGGVLELGVFRVLSSFFLGAVVPVANLAIKQSVPVERQGAAFGVAASATSAAFGVGPLGGGLLAAQFGFATPFLGPAFLLSLAPVVFLISPEFRRRAAHVLKDAASNIVK